ncbi:MAG: hypothetical protein WCM76_16765 [Bacteroidota bacterium]
MSSKGKCLYCGRLFDQHEMTNHLSMHIDEEVEKKPALRASAFYLKFESGDYFLHLLVKQNCTLRELDRFLRDIWLDCCGHSSEFIDRGHSVAMKWEIGQCMIEGMRWIYQYDFGDTTTLKVSVIRRFCIAMKKNITILSRNEPLKILCDKCKTHPAMTICPIHYHEEDNGRFCHLCSITHERECLNYNEDFMLPVVNSPRMGVCGYEGGNIDKERDKPYQDRSNIN